MTSPETNQENGREKIKKIGGKVFACVMAIVAAGAMFAGGVAVRNTAEAVRRNTEVKNASTGLINQYNLARNNMEHGFHTPEGQAEEARLSAENHEEFERRRQSIDANYPNAQSRFSFPQGSLGYDLIKGLIGPEETENYFAVYGQFTPPENDGF